MEAHRAYACKQILGICHLPKRLENQSVFLRKIEKPHGGKNKPRQHTKKPVVQGKMDDVCATYIMVCARKKRTLFYGEGDLRF